MLGRVLFALVCLLIVAGLALPLYPPALETLSTLTDRAVPDLQASDREASACEDCPIAAEMKPQCRPGCVCDSVVVTGEITPDGAFTFDVIVIMRERSGRLPAI
jgi:hypothetical protein